MYTYYIYNLGVFWIKYIPKIIHFLSLDKLWFLFMVHKMRYEMGLVLCDYVVRRYDTFNECNRGRKFISSLTRKKVSL